MASRSRKSNRADSDSDSMEAIKPLVVLVLFGTILYGAYSVVQKGSAPGTNPLPDAPPFAPPVIEVASAASSPPSPSPGVSPAVAAAASSPVMPAASPVATIGSPAPNAGPVVAPPPAVASTTSVPLSPGAAVTTPTHGETFTAPPTYLTAESAPPPGQDAVATPAPATTPTNADRPDRYASLPTTPPLPVTLTPGTPPTAPASVIASSSAAFAAAWTDAHVKLAAGRYAEALAALSIWHDDASLGLEESQRLDDLLGQLAGTVIYSSQDHLLPPHIVAAGETLPAIAMPLGVPWQLLGKINGVTDPQGLIPGEHLKVLRGPFDAVVSVSRRRLSLQLGGNYAGSFPVVIGRDFVSRVGSAIAVTDVRRDFAADPRSGFQAQGVATDRPAIVLADGLLIEAVDDPGSSSENSPSTTLLISRREFADIVDILGPGSKVLVRQ
ncbi:MAG: LysM peptidoglycan-binding domain-containing protein [Planctomycetota bacterium]